MHNIDDCLFKTSISISIEGDADVGLFEAQMENSYNLFVKTLRLELISSSPKLWSLTHHKDMMRPGSECIEAVFWLLGYFLKALPRYKDKLDNLDSTSISTTLLSHGEYPNWFLYDRFSDTEIREAFAHAINDGFISISYKGIVIRNYCLCICFELENLNNIYQYYWRSRWVLTLVNFLVNSQKTSKRISQKGAVIIRHFKKRLFKKPKQQG
jgi:hypothetical protein